MRLDLEIWETAGVLPTDSMWEAGRKLLRFNLQTLVQYEPIAVLGDDPEGVHKMRVITRRMRSLFDVFRGYLDMEYYKGVRKDLRSVAWVLGTVRDHDVLLMRMDAYIEAELGGDAVGLKAVHKAVIKRHKKAHKLMLNMFRDKDYDQFITHLYNLVSDPLKKFPDKSTKKRYTKTAAPLAYRVQEIAPRIIYDCLENVRAYESQLKDAKIDTLHSLRIEFKRFRYTLEFFSDVLGESVLRVIMATTAIQDHLGDLVDTSVGITILEDIREDLPKKKQGALGDYLKYLEKQRKYLKSTFPTAYEAFNQPELREALAEAIGGL
jgi:CHAD domain-containing protein